jgi:hypothetical protein
MILRANPEFDPFEKQELIKLLKPGKYLGSPKTSLIGDKLPTGRGDPDTPKLRIGGVLNPRNSFDELGAETWSCF